MEKKPLFLASPLRSALVLCFLAASIAPAYGFGLKTHLWIAQSMLAELQSGCRFEIGTVPVSIDAPLCRSIQQHPKAFMAGVLGPDAYPDLITGQVTTHPGIPGDWQTSDWLRHIYGQAKEGPELAFAAGYLTHAASDVFAHSYVNAYAGDIFVLKDERAVERRHFVLEKYIDSKLPGFAFDRRELEPPAEFVRDKLIYDSNAGRLARKAELAPHIVAIQAARAAIRSANRDIDKLELDSSGALKEVRAEQLQAETGIAQDQPQLALAEASLQTREGLLAQRQNDFDQASTALQSATAAFNAEAPSAAVRALRFAAQVQHDAQLKRLNEERGLTGAARAKVEVLRARLAKWRDQLATAATIRQTMQELIAGSSFLSGYMKNWEEGLDVAGREYINTSHRVVLGTLDHQSSFVREYQNWYKCYGSAFTPVPYQFGDAVCEGKRFYIELRSKLEEQVLHALPPRFAHLVQRYIEIKKWIREKVKHELDEAALAFEKLVAPDKTTGDFIALLARPEYATEAKLDEVFATTADANGKQLLEFASMHSYVNSDIGLQNDTLNPAMFNALRHALSLSKLSLVGHAGVRRIVWVLGGDPGVLAPPANADERYSVLYSMVRSIDGNQQWQPYGLPYARQDGGATPDAAERRYGYGPEDSARGFELFTIPSLRTTVFPRIFSANAAGEAGIAGRLMTHPKLAEYPFKECRLHPFPRTFNDDGTPLLEDRACQESLALAMPSAPTIGESVRRAASWLGFGP